MDTLSDNGLNERIAERARSLRAQLGLSLEALASRSGVSRSMLSLIERAECSPTAVVLDRLAAGLGVTLSSLLSEAPLEAHAAPQPLARLADQALWRDPGSGYVRRSVSPGGYPSPIQIVEVEFPAGARVAYETGPRDRLVHQQIWMREGTIEFTVGKQSYRLHAGDCLALELNQPTVFHNPTRKRARYAVVLVAEPVPRR